MRNDVSPVLRWACGTLLAAAITLAGCEQDIRTYVDTMHEPDEVAVYAGGVSVARLDTKRPLAWDSLELTAKALPPGVVCTSTVVSETEQDLMFEAALGVPEFHGWAEFDLDDGQYSSFANFKLHVVPFPIEERLRVFCTGDMVRFEVYDTSGDLELTLGKQVSPEFPRWTPEHGCEPPRVLDWMDVWRADGSRVSARFNENEVLYWHGSDFSEGETGYWHTIELRTDSFTSRPFYIGIDGDAPTIFLVERTGEAEFEIRDCLSDEELLCSEYSEADFAALESLVATAANILAQRLSEQGYDVLVLSPGFSSRPWQRDVEANPYVLTIAIGRQPGWPSIDPLEEMKLAPEEYDEGVLVDLGIYGGTSRDIGWADPILAECRRALAQALSELESQAWVARQIQGFRTSYPYGVEPEGNGFLDYLTSHKKEWGVLLLSELP